MEARLPKRRRLQGRAHSRPAGREPARGGLLESVSYDGEAYIAALLSTDSRPEEHGPRRIRRARRLVA